jgi:CHASE1-domain containing sensor protein
MAAGVWKAVNERLYLSKANGGGIVRREIWIDGQDRVVRYNLAYINPLIYSGDNGRVVGYDSAHGHHHRHYKGKVAVVSLSSFEQIEAQFQREWSKLAKEARHAKD